MPGEDSVINDNVFIASSPIHVAVSLGEHQRIYILHGRLHTAYSCHSSYPHRRHQSHAIQQSHLGRENLPKAYSRELTRQTSQSPEPQSHPGGAPSIFLGFVILDASHRVPSGLLHVLTGLLPGSPAAHTQSRLRIPRSVQALMKLLVQNWALAQMVCGRRCSLHVCSKCCFIVCHSKRGKWMGIAWTTLELRQIN